MDYEYESVGRKIWNLTKREEQALECAKLMVDNRWSVRVVAENVRLSKSYVHTLLTRTIASVDADLYVQCKHILFNHKTMKRDCKGRFCR